jgi:hypothetical protein
MASGAGQGQIALLCAFIAAVALAWWLREESWLVDLLAAALTIVPLAGLWVLVSLHLPHGAARWHALLPGALLIAIGFQVLHGLVVNFLVPKLDKATTLYGGPGRHDDAPLLHVHRREVRRHGARPEQLAPCRDLQSGWRSLRRFDAAGRISRMIAGASPN